MKSGQLATFRSQFPLSFRLSHFIFSLLFMPWSLHIRAVVFDAVGTLMSPDPPVASAYAATARRFGSRLDQTEIERGFGRAFARQEQVDLARGDGRTSEARERERWRAIVAECVPDATDAEGLFLSLWNHFASPAHWRVFPDAARAWAELARRGVPRVVASNFDGRLHGLLAGLPPLAGAAGTFISSEVGYRKPACEFFGAIGKALGLPAESLLMVGDDERNDVASARACGWQAVHVDRRGRIAGGGAVRDLGELLDAERAACVFRRTSGAVGSRD